MQLGARSGEVVVLLLAPRELGNADHFDRFGRSVYMNMHIRYLILHTVYWPIRRGWRVMKYKFPT